MAAFKGASAGMPADGRMMPDARTFNADKGISLEQFLYYAKEQRRAERDGLDYRNTEATLADFAIGSRPVEHPHHEHASAEKDDALEKKGSDSDGGANVVEARPTISADQLERINARRALRVASWGGAFFLITTDILGPFNAPYAVQQVGLVPGALLYFFMGVAASFTGYCIQILFCSLDSERLPVVCYATIADRIFGRWAYWGVSLFQGIYLVLNVGVICLSNGQGLEQIIQGPNGTGNLCFVVCILIMALIGMMLAQIRGLRNYSYLSSTAVFQNIIICIIVIAFAARSNPNYAAANAAYGIDAGPVVTELFAVNPIATQVNGVMNMVFAYGGAQIFPEILAEMRRPMDFWKGLAIAQLLFICVYMVFGEVVYALQGQFTLALVYQGIGPYSGQTVCNVFALITGLLAAGLYGNIGLKVVYINVVEGLFKGPPLMSKRGRLLWSPLAVLYWSIAFILGTGIPQVGAFTGLIGAVAIVPLTYAFPLTLVCALFVHKSAMRGDGEFIPGKGPQRIDSWKQASRWKRGFMGGNPMEVVFKFALLILALAAYALTGLGIYGSSLALAGAFQASSATSFGCSPPV